MKKVFLIPALAVALLAAGCSGNQEKKHEGHAEVKEEHVDHHAEEPSAVVLNKGEKWEANAETTTGINNMISLVEKNKSNPDYAALKADLNQEFTTVLQKCTMKGEAHEQLHNYLLPLKDKFETINAGSGAKAVEEIEGYLKTYSTYFK